MFVRGGLLLFVALSSLIGHLLLVIFLAFSVDYYQAWACLQFSVTFKKAEFATTFNNNWSRVIWCRKNYIQMKSF